MVQQLTIPILLFLGFATRIATLPLLGMIAVIQTFVYPLAYKEHLVCGAILVLLLTRVPGNSRRLPHRSIRATQISSTPGGACAAHASQAAGRSALARFGRDDLLRDVSEIRRSDIRLWSGRVEDLSRPGDEGRGTSRTQRADDIPGMRRHES